MKFTAEHDDLRKTVREFVKREINPYVDAWEEAEQFPSRELFRKLGAAGLLGLTRDPGLGGLGLDFSFSVVMAEELGHVRCGAVPMAIGVHTDMCTPALARFGSDELKREFLAPAIAGDQIGCIGVSEEGAGSDVASIKTRARVDGDDYVISGSKMWITNGIMADWMCTLVNTSDGDAHRNKSLVMIPMNTKGVERAKKLKKLGMWSSDTAQIFLDEVRVPRRYRIGEEGAGFKYQMLQFQEERLWAVANATSVMDDALTQTAEYTRDRKAFGRPILDNQWVHFHLAELSTEVEALRALLYRATEQYVEGKDVTRLASMAKLKAGRLGRELVDWCLQFQGAQGYMWEARISRMMRDTRLLSIGAGADEVMLGVIAKLEGTAPRSSGKPA